MTAGSTAIDGEVRMAVETEEATDATYVAERSFGEHEDYSQMWTGDSTLEAVGDIEFISRCQDSVAMY
jgi:hypothetical protein